MEVIGTIVKVGELVTGESARGEWKKKELIIETDEMYSKTICLQLWGDEVENSLIKQGNKLRFLISIQSREYNSRWYTDVRAYSIHELKDGLEDPGLDDIFGPSDDDPSF